MPARVAVCMISYQHEPYLAEAIESALAQEGDFSLEVVVGVDVSTDRSAEIAQDYERRHPGRVRALVHSRRMGMMPNLMATFAACADADYVAMLEGDDRWTHPGKIAAQLRYMESNPGCAVCYHDVRIRHEGTEPRTESAPRARRDGPWSLEQFIVEPHWLYTCSAFYRNGLRGVLPAWMAGLKVGDWPMHVLHAALGWVGRLAGEWAEYRVHPHGVWSGASLAGRERVFLEVYERLDEHFARRYHESFLALAYARYLNVACMTDDEEERRWALAQAAACARERQGAWPWRFELKRLLGYRVLRAWRILAYGRPGGRT